MSCPTRLDQRVTILVGEEATHVVDRRIAAIEQRANRRILDERPLHVVQTPPPRPNRELKLTARTETRQLPPPPFFQSPLTRIGTP